MKPNAAAIGLILILFGGAINAAIPEPDAVLYGDVCINGQRVLSTSDVTILACTNCAGGYAAPGIGSYHMGDTVVAGNQYVLRMRLESLADGGSASANAARVGNTAYVYIQQGAGLPTFARTYVIADRGTIVRADLTIGGVCTVVGVVSSDPPNGAIDARQPSDINGANPTGWNSIRVTFSGAASSLTAADFEVTSVGAAPPSVTTVAPSGNNLTVNLSSPIPAGARTTIRYRPTGAEIQLAAMPADVNGDGTSSSLDIITLINALNGVVVRPIWSTDINRSNQTNSQDIIREIDLLNGAGAYDPWNGRSLP